jgi:hypothetical protein
MATKLKEESRGRVEVEYRIICGRCGEWIYSDGGTKREAIKEPRDSGWGDTDLWGLICPACVDELVSRENAELVIMEAEKGKLTSEEQGLQPEENPDRSI